MRGGDVSFVVVLRSMLGSVVVALLLLVLFAVVFFHFDVQMRREHFSQVELTSLALQRHSIARTLTSITEDMTGLQEHQYQHGFDSWDDPHYRTMMLFEMETLCRIRQQFDQLRILDNRGQERVRVDCLNGFPVAVSGDKLQDQSRRDYFSSALVLGEGEVFISPLSVEQESSTSSASGRPILRLSTPLTSPDGERTGILVINYLADELLTSAEAGVDQPLKRSPQGGYLYLVNSNGVTFNSLPDGYPRLQSGGYSLAKQFPSLWEQIELSESGTVPLSQGLLNFITYRPLQQVDSYLPDYPEDLAKDSGYSSRMVWKLLSFVPSEQLQFGVRQYAIKMAIIVPLLLLILLPMLYQVKRSALQRRLMVGEMESQRVYLQTMMDAMSDGVVAVDAYGSMQVSNDSLEEMFCYAPDELMGHPVSKLLGRTIDEEAGSPLQWMERLMEHYPDGRELICRNRYADEIPMEVSVRPFTQGQKEFFLLMFRDITERKKAEKEVESLHLKYCHREKMAEVGLLVGGILHEVANPMAAIQGLLLELMADDEESEHPLLNADGRARIQLIIDHVDRVKGISREVSSFLRPASYSFELSDLNGIVQTTTRLIRFDKRWREIQLDEQLDPSLPPVNAIADQLVQVIMNLLVNAADACGSEPDRDSRVTIRSLSEEGMAVLEISDNGSGMSAETLQQIFEPFYTTKAEGQGTGLGMPLCEGIINDHGGRMEVESGLGEGTRVRVYLPLASLD
ncbi:sensor histidine kinase [Aestuariirhabdus litorea]|uniref:histidine kinase n=1 Tax=Aestuariirhabdus litorea TaxID=2528527 RepID=A0A3P3VTH6_9GAMM|nr:PAS domain-containing sensor histidine kinase [Aestuariirhabdus litorea]RRJ85268.1 sensor histidine kinase [Aestuariirhabdus litorea]RWW98490.1 PAS domain S-box protein [Endozoicomonadaceae bacterium GTF-13]